MLEVQLLGPLAVSVDGVAVALAPGRPRIVLAHLALEAGRIVPRASLIRSLWEDDPPASAVNVVQVAVSSLRRALGADAIVSSPGGYALGAAAVDVVDLLAGARRGARAAEAGDDVAVGAAIAPLIERFRTPLEDLGESLFAIDARTSITDRYLAAVEQYSASAVRSGRADAVVGLLPDLVAEHPLREALLEQLVLALGAVGRETEALAAYDAGRNRIADALGVDPGTRLRAAYERVIRQDLPAQGAASVHRLRIARPASASALIGRDADLAALTRLLDRPGVRLVSLVGPTGIGKSQLAAAVLTGTEGVLVRVSGASTAESVAAAVVRGAIEPPPAGDARAALVAALEQRNRTLLVLDGLQPTSDVAELVEDLLGAVPGLQVIATTTRPLRTASEHRFPIAPLATDAVDGSWSPAAELLVERLVRDRGGSVPDEDRRLVEAVARLCDGVPLALELAAGAAAVRSLGEVRDRLEQAGAGEGVTGAMQAGLADLPDDATAILRAATCFVDGGTVAVLGEVAGLEPQAADAAALELRDRGLVRRRGGDGSVRLRVLGPVRDAVLAQTDPAALDAVRTAFVRRVAERYAGHAWFERVPRTLSEVVETAAALPDIRTALALAADSASPLLPGMVARLAWASTVFATGADWRRWRDAALALPTIADEDRFDLLVAAPEDTAAFDGATSVLERLRDPARTGWLRFRQARIALDRGDLDAGEAAVVELAAIVGAETGGAAPFLRARLLDARQMLALRRGDAEQSLELAEQAMRAAVDEGRSVEAELLEVVRIEVLTVAGRVQEAADAALDLIELTAGASPWLRGAVVSLRGVALLRQGAAAASIDAQRTAVGLMLGSPWRIERLEVLARWAAARIAVDAGDRDAGFALGVWAAVMRRLELAPWPLEQALADGIDRHGGPDDGGRRSGEQAVRLDGPDRAVEDAMIAILDGRRLIRRRS